jgi:beta-glucosidase
MEIIRQPLDFYGYNIYSCEPVRAAPEGLPERVARPKGYPQTAMGWPVAPESLRWGPRFLFERYALPLVITENGMANLDWVSADGKVHDPQRIDFTSAYLRELAKAIKDGTDVRGYFHWSIMDNFEWAEGYAKRFGLVHVDFATGKRTLKDSAEWYSRVIQGNGAVLYEGEAGSVKVIAKGRPGRSTMEGSR